MKVVITVKDAHEAMMYMEQIVRDGLVNGKDFIWWFMPRESDDWTTIKEPALELEFTDPSIATFYQLKWTK